MISRFPGIVRQPAPQWEHDGPLDLDELTCEQSHCSPCGDSFDGSPELCPSCGEDTLITTWGDAQAERFWSGERYSSDSTLGWRPFGRYLDTKAPAAGRGKR